MSPELYDLIRAGGENVRRNYRTRLTEQILFLFQVVESLFLSVVSAEKRERRVS